MIQADDAQVRWYVDDAVRRSVEETLVGLWEAVRRLQLAMMIDHNSFHVIILEAMKPSS